MKVLYDSDVDTLALAGRRVAVLGYGSQGRAQACNLKDSGIEVAVGLRPGSRAAGQAEADGLAVLPIGEAVSWAEIAAVLLPDERHGEVFREVIAPRLRDGKALLFAHGFSIHFGLVRPPPGIDVCMVAPKGIGPMVRRSYLDGGGVPCLVAVAQDSSGGARSRALGYAAAIGGGRAGIVETTFREECETDLFGEQTVLCGGATALVLAAFETLVAAGYPAELAYFECLHELKLTVDLMHQRGISGMRAAISNTAKYGDVTRGPRIVSPAVREEMRRILAEITSGAFAREWVAEVEAGRPVLDELLRRGAEHPIERVGERIRALTASGGASEGRP